MATDLSLYVSGSRLEVDHTARGRLGSMYERVVVCDRRGDRRAGPTGGGHHDPDLVSIG